MDDIAEFNKARWEELSAAGVTFSVPWLDLTKHTAYEAVNKEGIQLQIRDKEVLCLAASGGQQSAAFGVLGARVTVFDLSRSQLEKDTVTAAHYGFPIHVVQGDMRDLRIFPSNHFDLVWLAHGINFVPDARAVITEVARVLRFQGYFRLEVTNPYVHGVWENWNAPGYLITEPYKDGGEIHYADSFWEFESANGSPQRIQGPREFRHSLATIMNTLISNGLRILGLWEDCRGDPSAEPGSWKHFKSRVPPWMTIWTRKLDTSVKE